MMGAGGGVGGNLTVGAGGPGAIEASGGVISDYSTPTAVYRTHIFTSSGTFDVTTAATSPTLPNTIEYVVVGGGGGGGSEGGGGAGGYRSSVTGEATGGGGTLESSVPVSVASYVITVGGGGHYVTGTGVNEGAINTIPSVTF